MINIIEHQCVGEQIMTSSVEKPTVLHSSHLNKGSAFNLEERDAYHLRGLLPPRVFNQQQQATRFLNFLRRKTSDVENILN